MRKKRIAFIPYNEAHVDFDLLSSRIGELIVNTDTGDIKLKLSDGEPTLIKGIAHYELLDLIKNGISVGSTIDDDQIMMIDTSLSTVPKDAVRGILKVKCTEGDKVKVKSVSFIVDADNTLITEDDSKITLQDFFGNYKEYVTMDTKRYNALKERIELLECRTVDTKIFQTSCIDTEDISIKLNTMPTGLPEDKYTLLEVIANIGEDVDRFQLLIMYRSNSTIDIVLNRISSNVNNHISVYNIGNKVYLRVPISNANILIKDVATVNGNFIRFTDNISRVLSSTVGYTDNTLVSESTTSDEPSNCVRYIQNAHGFVGVTPCYFKNGIWTKANNVNYAEAIAIPISINVLRVYTTGHINVTGMRTGKLLMTADKYFDIDTTNGVMKETAQDTQRIGYTYELDDNCYFVIDINKESSHLKDGYMTKEDKIRIDGMEDNANNYIHAKTHPASMITEETDIRFINDEEKMRVQSSKNAPLDSLYGSIRVVNGRLLTSGAFNNIYGLEKASIEEYGDTKIITTPDNSFNCILYKDSEGTDRIYLGESYSMSDKVIPVIPDNYTFPGGALSFKNTGNVGYNNYSYILNKLTCYNNSSGDARILYNAINDIFCIHSFTNDTNLYFSNIYESVNRTTSNIGTVRKDILTLATPYSNINSNLGGVDSINQFSTYRAVLTKQQFEDELTKDICIEGEIDITSVIENNTFASQIFGSLYGGYLNNAGDKVAGRLYTDIKTMKLYKCLNNNTDTSATVDNYSAYSLDDFKDDINTRQIRHIPNLTTDAKNIDEAIIELNEKKLEKDAVATAESLGAIKIGAGFRILEDGTLILDNIQREERYDGTLLAGEDTIYLPRTMNPSAVTRVYVDGTLLQPTKHYTFDTGAKTVTVLDTYRYDAEVTVLNYEGYQSGEYSEADKTKLDGIEANANKYVHPETHSADMIDETETRKFMTSSEKSRTVDMQSDLDSRIDTVIEVFDGKLRMASKSGIKIKDIDETINYNDNGVTRSLSGDASFKVCEDKLYLGAGYDNLYSFGLGVSNNPIYIDGGFEVTLVRNDGAHHTCKSNIIISANTKFNVSFDLEVLSGTLSGKPYFGGGALVNLSDATYDLSTEELTNLNSQKKIHISCQCVTNVNDLQLSRIWTEANEEDPATVRFSNMQITLGEGEKPYVKKKTYDGNIQLEGTEHFNLDEYSVIMTGLERSDDNQTKDNSNNIIYRSPNGSIYSKQNIDMVLCSNIYTNAGILHSNVIMNNISIGKGITALLGSTSFSKFLLYKGVLTEDELKNEYAKINHNDNILNNISDVHGDAKVYNAVTVTSSNIDIPYILNKYYNIVTSDNKTYSIFVDSDGAIEDNIVMRDVSGYIRIDVNKFPCQLTISDSRMFVTLESVKIKPDERIHGAIWVEEGELYTSGAFNNIYGLEKAKIEEYGDTKIITTPDNSFNCILYKDSEGIDRIYLGEGYTNEFEAIGLSNTISITKLDDGYYEMEQIEEASTRYNFARKYHAGPGTIAIMLDVENEYAQGHICGGGEHIEFTGVSWISYRNDILGNCGINFKLGTPIGTKVKFKIQVISGAYEKPFIPSGYTFPRGALKFKGTESMNFVDYSYIVTNADNDEDGHRHTILQKDKFALVMTELSNKSQVAYSELSDIKCYIGVLNGQYDILQVGYDNGAYRFVSMTNLISYKGVLTEQELKAELDKDMIIDGAVNVTEKIRNNTKNAYIMGGDCNGIINNTETKVKDNIYFDTSLGKVFVCLADNTYDYAQADSYAPISLHDLRVLIDTNNDGSGLPTTAKTIFGAIAELLELVNTKQDMQDNELATTSKTIVSAINEINSNLINLDLTPYQTKSDSGLSTTAKTVVSAINEVNNKVNNLDFTPYQTKSDSGLSTTAKTVVSAINEVKGNFRGINWGTYQTRTDTNLETVSKDVVTAINEINDKKEPNITKKTAFNLDKVDVYTTNDTSKLPSAKALYALYSNRSSSVTSTSTTVFANSAAVKSAYDRGSLGITNAATAQSKANSAYTLAGTMLPKTGGTVTGDILFSNSTKGIQWYMNTDSASITFKNDSDSDTDSYLEFATGDNGDEYFKWTMDSIEKASLKGDGLRVGGAIWENGYQVYSPNNRNISSSVASTSTTVYANSAAVKSAYDRGSLGVTNAATAQTKANSAYTLAGTKEPAIVKKSGFNLDKSDSATSASTTTLATSKAAKSAYDRGSLGVTNAATAQTKANSAYTLAGTMLPKSGGTISGNLVVTSTIYCNGNITGFSDSRLKENLEVIPNAIDKVNAINGYTFNMINDPDVRMTGVIAQELEKVLPEAVINGPSGYKSVAYGNIVGLLIEAIKEQNKRIEELEKGQVK